jgi:hypothetical protein
MLQYWLKVDITKKEEVFIQWFRSKRNPEEFGKEGWETPIINPKLPTKRTRDEEAANLRLAEDEHGDKRSESKVERRSLIKPRERLGKLCADVDPKFWEFSFG